MLKGALTLSIAVLSLALIATALVPGLATAPERTAQVETPAEAPVAERPADRQMSGYREASLAADARGQYAADVLVDGVSVRMLVDTGATVVTISAATAARLGLAPSPGPKWKIQTANGKSLASPVMLASVSFGGLYLRDVQALILAPEAGDANLLGASFLKRLVERRAARRGAGAQAVGVQDSGPKRLERRRSVGAWLARSIVAALPPGQSPGVGEAVNDRGYSARFGVSPPNNRKERDLNLQDRRESPSRPSHKSLRPGARERGPGGGRRTPSI